MRTFYNVTCKLIHIYLNHLMLAELAVSFWEVSIVSRQLHSVSSKFLLVHLKLQLCEWNNTFLIGKNYFVNWKLEKCWLSMSNYDLVAGFLSLHVIDKRSERYPWSSVDASNPRGIKRWWRGLCRTLGFFSPVQILTILQIVFAIPVLNLCLPFS